MIDHTGALLDTLFDSLEGPAFALDRNLAYLRFNEAHRQTMVAVYGVSPRVGDRLPSLIEDPDQRALAQAHLLAALAGEVVDHVSPVGGASATERTMRITHRPLREGTGGPIFGVLVTARDLTAEMEYQRASEASSRQLQDVLDASETAFWTYDGDSGSAYYSDRYYTMLGYDPGAFPMVLESWIDRLHPDDREPVVGSFRHFIQTQTTSFELEFRMRTATGGWRWILGRARVIDRDHRGRPRRVAGTNVDITRLKLVEEALAESEARWTSLVDGAPAGITLLGPQGQILFMNRQEAADKPGPFLGRNWKEFLDPALHDQADRLVEAGFSRGSLGDLESYRTGADGQPRYYHNQVAPVRDGDQVSALMVLSTDVTAARRSEARQAKASRRMEILLRLHNTPGLGRQQLFDTALDAAVELTDSQIGYIYFYSEATGLFTLHAWSKIVMDHCRVAEPQTTYSLEKTGFWGEAVRQRKALVANDFETQTEFHRGLPPGHVALTRFLTIPVFDGDQIVAVVGVGNKALPYDGDDITELQTLADGLWQFDRRRQAELELERLHQAVEDAPVSIVITDLKGTIEYANPRFSTVTGYTPAEVLGTNIRLVKSGLVPLETYQNLWKTILSGREWEGELVNRRKSGELYIDWASISPVLDSAGAITHFVSVKEDITDRKAAQDLVYRAQRMETVGQLAAGIAHDFNNLLTSVLAYDQMLLRKLAPEDPLRVYAERIELSGRRAADLVSSLLSVGRQQRLAKERLDLAAWLRTEEPLLAGLVQNELTFGLEVPAGPLWVEADPGTLGQVVANLVSNARDALGDRGSIRVTAGVEGAEVWFRVEDDGPGIPPEIQDKIFDPFFTTKAIGQGTGLGLSVVQGIVHQHGGSLTLDSVVGQGTRFTVRLASAS